MIIDNKVLLSPPPPPYSQHQGPPPFPGATPAPPTTLRSLSPHILLQIVYSTFPQAPSVNEGKVERQRKTLLWLVGNLRLVNRSFYIACMHVLRSTYLPAYQSLIRPPYTSDPFPTTTTNSRSPTYAANTTPDKPLPIQSLQRETAILDRFIALKVREDVFVDDSELHLEREDMFKDLFDLAQPRARLEDLVRLYGLREGAISVPGATVSTYRRRDEHSKSAKPSPSHSSSSLSLTPPVSPLAGPSSPQPRSVTSRFFSAFSRTPKSPSPTISPYSLHQPSTPLPKFTPIPFSTISISLSPRTIGLVAGSAARKRTLVQIQRNGRDESLEVGAKRIVRELKDMLLAEAQES